MLAGRREGEEGGAHETVQIVEDFDRADAVRAPVCEGDGS
jgi:hypothetical protein